MLKLFFVLLCLLASVIPWLDISSPHHMTHTDFPGWPSHFAQRPLQSLPLTPLEQQFQQDFPGYIGRFSDGKREIILRWVKQSSRRLHPASDCFKAHGYTITPQPLLQQNGERWGSFIASSNTQKLRILERIYDSQGQQWSDVSAWYWAVQMGKTSGPWWAVTVAERA